MKMARRSLSITSVGCVVVLVLVCDTVAQSLNTSTAYLPNSVGSGSTYRDNWLRTGLNTILQYAGGRFFPMRTSAGVRFILYTRRGKERVEMSQSSIEASGFDSSNPTTILVHGYYNKVVGQSAWLEQVAQALLNKGPWNVIMLDWSRLCSVFYASTVVRARSIPGPVTADLLRMLQYVKGLDLSTVHVIGFSLGAHVAGFVGQNIQGIGRITGLDPAGPKFRAVNPSKRLSPDDALFVDVVNTNVGSFIAGLSLGMNLDVSVGHVSVNFNGGEHQPGCWVGSSCSHYRAPIYFIESLQLADDFLVYPCEGSNKALPVPFGLHMPHTARGCYFATANRNEPYLQTPSPRPLQHPTTESSDIFEDDVSSTNRRGGDPSRHLEQDYLGQVPLLGFPESMPLIEQEQDQEPEQVLESEQLLNPEQVLESEQLMDPEQVLEPEQLLNLEQIIETEQLLNAEQVLESEQLLNPEQVLESEQILNPQQVLESEQLMDPEQVLEPEQLLNPEQVIETEQLLNAEQVLESEQLMNPKRVLEIEQLLEPHNILEHQKVLKPVKLQKLEHFFEPGQLLELKQIVQPKQFSEERNVLEPNQVPEPKWFIDPEHIFNINKFPKLKKTLQSVQWGPQDQVPRSDHTFESFKSSKPQQPNESQEPIHSSISMPSMAGVGPVQSLPPQPPVALHEALHYMVPAEGQNFLPIVKPAKSTTLPTLSQPQPKPVQMPPPILSPQKPLEPPEVVRRRHAAKGHTVQTTPKPITMSDILAPRSKSISLKSFEDYDAKLAYDWVLAQF